MSDRAHFSTSLDMSWSQVWCMQIEKKHLFSLTVLLPLGSPCNYFHSCLHCLVQLSTPYQAHKGAYSSFHSGSK